MSNEWQFWPATSAVYMYMSNFSALLKALLLLALRAPISMLRASAKKTEAGL